MQEKDELIKRLREQLAQKAREEIFSQANEEKYGVDALRQKDRSV